jgi:hypothetical protein
MARPFNNSLNCSTLTFTYPVDRTDWAEERRYEELVRSLKRRVV